MVEIVTDLPPNVVITEDLGLNSTSLLSNEAIRLIVQRDSVLVDGSRFAVRSVKMEVGEVSKQLSDHRVLNATTPPISFALVIEEEDGKLKSVNIPEDIRSRLLTYLLMKNTENIIRKKSIAFRWKS